MGNKRGAMKQQNPGKGDACTWEEEGRDARGKKIRLMKRTKQQARRCDRLGKGQIIGHGKGKEEAKVMDEG